MNHIEFAIPETIKYTKAFQDQYGSGVPMSNAPDSQKKPFNLEEFSKKSEEYYKQIKFDLESKYKGKYVALDADSSNYWIGDTATDAMSKAKEKFPEKLFYLLQIGSAATFNIQTKTIRSKIRRKYDFAWTH